MEVNRAMMEDLASRLGLAADEQNLEKASKMAASMEGADEQTLLREMQALKNEMKSDPRAYRKQMQILQALRGMMRGEQRQRLERILAMLESDR